jgi:hypothetical protein
MPVIALNCSVSSESMDVPEGQPVTDLRPPMIEEAGTAIESRTRRRLSSSRRY